MRYHSQTLGEPIRRDPLTPCRPCFLAEDLTANAEWDVVHLPEVDNDWPWRFRCRRCGSINDDHLPMEVVPDWQGDEPPLAAV